MSEFLREVKGILGALCVLEDGKRNPAKYQDQQGRVLYAWAMSLVSEVADQSWPREILNANPQV